MAKLEQLITLIGDVNLHLFHLDSQRCKVPDSYWSLVCNLFSAAKCSISSLHVTNITVFTYCSNTDKIKKKTQRDILALLNKSWLTFELDVQQRLLLGLLWPLCWLICCHLLCTCSSLSSLLTDNYTSQHERTHTAMSSQLSSHSLHAGTLLLAQSSCRRWSYASSNRSYNRSNYLQGWKKYFDFILWVCVGHWLNMCEGVLLLLYFRVLPFFVLIPADSLSSSDECWSVRAASCWNNGLSSI